MEAFNARYVSTFSLDRLYRTYVDRGEIYLIRIGGQGGGARGAASQFGLLGSLLYNLWKSGADARLAERSAASDVNHPSVLLGEHRHNLRASFSEIESSIIEPEAAFDSHGPHVGRWRLKIRGHNEMRLQFEALPDMNVAVSALRSVGG